MSTPGTVPKYWLGFSYMHSKGYELYMKFNEIKFKINQTAHPAIKLNYFAKILWSSRNNSFHMNLTDGEKFPMGLIKRAKSRINQKNST